jgi:hypothetical protein
MYSYDPIQADETHNLYIYRGFILRLTGNKWEAIPSLYPYEYTMFSAAQGWVHTILAEIDRYWDNVRDVQTNVFRDLQRLSA